MRTLMNVEGVMISFGYPIPDKAGGCGSSPQWPTFYF